MKKHITASGLYQITSDEGHDFGLEGYLGYDTLDDARRALQMVADRNGLTACVYSPDGELIECAQPTSQAVEQARRYHQQLEDDGAYE